VKEQEYFESIGREAKVYRNENWTCTIEQHSVGTRVCMLIVKCKLGVYS